MNWSQEQLKKFWEGVGAKEDIFGIYLLAGPVIVGKRTAPDTFDWLDPSELPLSTLLDILERLARGMNRTKHGFLWDEIGVVRVDRENAYAVRVRDTSCNYTQRLIDATYPTRELAVVAAISALLNLEMPEGK